MSIKTRCKLFASFCCLFFSINVNAQRVWQNLSLPKSSELAAKFKNYPSEYAHTLTWGWDGPVSRESIIKDLNAINLQGIKVVTIEAGYKMQNPYLSAGWFETIKIAVEEAKKLNMRVWIIDEGKYPSGFAGGKFSQEKPELRMQGLVVANRIAVTEGQEISKKLTFDIVSAVAVNQQDKTNIILDVSAGVLNWKAPEGKGSWQVILVQHRFKTSVTRAANNPSGGKDTVNSLCDYLNPEATRQFIEFTHEQYKKYIGNEFGKTVMGFRGDEPDYGFTPWTPKIADEFKKQKGYNVLPFLASFFTQNPNDEQKRAKADYWDVWSDLFADNFFKIQADWCAKNNLEYMTHLNHEEKMMDLVRSSGDFFKNMRHVQIPGVDAIWNQVWPDKVADFPKLASSAAHLFGRPRALSESFAAYTIPPSVAQAKWCVDYQLVRGINLFEYMFWSGSAGGSGMPKSYLGQVEFPKLADYSNRAAYLLANGIPAAKIALFHPTSSMWLGDEDANKSVLRIAKELSEKQYDYDFVDEQALSEVLKIDKSGFKNLSGQSYSVVIIPSVSVLSVTTFQRLQDFSKEGGKVIFLGRTPAFLVEKNFMTMAPAPVINWAKIKSSGELSSDILKLLPQDVSLNKEATAVKYLHRKWKDAEMYFFFNESTNQQDLVAELQGSGTANVWNAETGEITSLPIIAAGINQLKLPLKLKPQETTFIVINTKK